MESNDSVQGPKKGPEEVQRYLQDLKTIKEILIQHDERPLLENWAFIVWGILIAIATAVHALLAGTAVSESLSLPVLIWIPAVVIGGAFEVAAWARQIRKEEAPLFGRRLARFMLNFMAIGISTFAVIIATYAHGALSPGILMCLSALFFTACAQGSFTALFYEGYLLLALGVLFIALGLGGSGAYVTAGVVGAATFVATGIHSEVLTRRARE